MKFKALFLAAGLSTSSIVGLHAQDAPSAALPADSLPVAPPAASQPFHLAFANAAPLLPASSAVALPAMPAAESTAAAAPLGFFVGSEPRAHTDAKGSAYIPVDSWIYPEMTRLYSMGYAGTMFLGMRPFTRRSLLHVLQASQDDIMSGDNEEAKLILAAVLRELTTEVPSNSVPRGNVYGTESVYTRLMGVDGLTLRDSYHLGQTLVNDYGRPYQQGFNTSTGFSTLAEHGRFSLYVRGEYQHSPAGPGYSQQLSGILSDLDLGGVGTFTGYNAHQATIPTGPIAAQNPFRLMEANLSVHLLGHEISGGKSDAWLGPGMGGALAWSNNAENIYSFRVNRIEPLYIPYFSRIVGTIRYDFFYGSLKGHTYPNSPWTDSFMLSFRPTKNFEFGFQRTIIFGGQGHSPVTLHTFLKSFFNLDDVNVQEKYSRFDPGARYSDFNFSWRLPFVRKYATLYVDSIAHDDISPPTAPRRAAYRTGIEISQMPGLRPMEFRFEGISTDPPVTRSLGGQFNYYETIQRQAYTNKGFIMGDWIGREAKGGQAWFTYHLSGTEWVQLELLHKKNARDFIAGGTTQNSLKATVVKRFGHDLELNAWLQVEQWKAPIYLPGRQTNTVGALQLTYYPKLRTFNAK